MVLPFGMTEEAEQKEVSQHKMILKENVFFLLLATLKIVGCIPKQGNIKRGARNKATYLFKLSLFITASGALPSAGMSSSKEVAFIGQFYSPATSFFPLHPQRCLV